MKYTTIRYNLTVLDLSKKPVSRLGECGHEIILYNAGIANYTVQTARRVSGLPGGFCRFLRTGKFSSLFSLRKAALRVKPVPLNALLAERESTTHHPPAKGGEKMETNPRGLSPC